MTALILILDFLILFICMISTYFSYRLWVLLGRRGLTVWFMYGMIYSVILRLTSIASDAGLRSVITEYTRVTAAPMYIFLLLGLVGLYRQVSHTIRLTKK
jgi:hypothetical protein